MAKQRTWNPEELRPLVGVWTAPQTAHAICLSDIRRWAIATHWPEDPPLVYWDEAEAKKTRFVGIVAPQEFNPFAWSIKPPPPDLRLSKATAGLTGLNGGRKEIYGVRMRAGDVISRRTTLANWNEQTGRHGLMLYLYKEARWTNQRDELVKTIMSTSIWY